MESSSERSTAKAETSSDRSSRSLLARSLSAVHTVRKRLTDRFDDRRMSNALSACPHISAIQSSQSINYDGHARGKSDRLMTYTYFFDGQEDYILTKEFRDHLVSAYEKHVQDLSPDEVEKWTGGLFQGRYELWIPSSPGTRTTYLCIGFPNSE